MRTLALLRDLFFRSKLDAVAQSLGAEIEYVSTLDQARKRCSEAAPAIVVADLSDQAFPATEAARIVRESAPAARLIGFASHVDLKSLSSAREAGFTLTLSRQEFTARLPELLQASKDPSSNR